MDQQVLKAEAHDEGNCALLYVEEAQSLAETGVELSLLKIFSPMKDNSKDRKQFVLWCLTRLKWLICISGFV